MEKDIFDIAIQVIVSICVSICMIAATIKFILWLFFDKTTLKDIFKKTSKLIFNNHRSNLDCVFMYGCSWKPIDDNDIRPCLKYIKCNVCGETHDHLGCKK